MSSREPERLPSLRELGDRLNEAAAREISSARRGRRRRPWILLGVAGALVAAGGATATRVFTGSGEPVQGERSTRNAPLQPGVLADSAAADPADGALPWAIRVFSDDQGRECVQLGRLSGGRLGTVLSGQFRVFAGNPVGPCTDLAKDGVLASFQRRAQPARTILYGVSGGRAPVTVKLGGETRRVTPGALGGFVIVFDGLRDVGGATVRSTVDGRPVTLRY